MGEKDGSKTRSRFHQGFIAQDVKKVLGRAASRLCRLPGSRDCRREGRVVPWLHGVHRAVVKAIQGSCASSQNTSALTLRNHHAYYCRKPGVVGRNFLTSPLMEPTPPALTFGKNIRFQDGSAMPVRGDVGPWARVPFKRTAFPFAESWTRDGGWDFSRHRCDPGFIRYPLRYYEMRLCLTQGQ